MVGWCLIYYPDGSAIGSDDSSLTPLILCAAFMPVAAQEPGTSGPEPGQDTGPKGKGTGLGALLLAVIDKSYLTPCFGGFPGFGWKCLIAKQMFFG